MAGNTFIQIPPDVTNATSLKRFLDKLVLQLDIAFGNRGNGAFSQVDTLEEVLLVLDNHEGRIVTLEDSVLSLTSTVTDLANGELVVIATANYTTGAATKTIVCKASSDITVTLPSCILTSGRSKVIGITNTTDTVVTIVPSDSATLAGEASQVLYQYEVLNFICDGTNWELAN